MSRSPRRRQELRTWARLTGGRLRVAVDPLELQGARWPASLGPATVADAQAFTTWLATRRRWGLVPDAVPMREQPTEVWVDPRPTPERWEPSVLERVHPHLQALHEADSYAKAIALGDPSQAPEWTPEACSGEPGCRCRACWQIGET